MKIKEPLFYTESQGEKEDKKILERYKAILNYYVENPDRIIPNWRKLYALYQNDIILKRDVSLDSLLEEVVIPIKHFLNTSPSKKSSF